VTRITNRTHPPSKDEILAFIGKQPGKVGTREIARAFGLKNADRAALKRMLRELGDQGEVERRGKKLNQPGTLPNVVLADVGARDRDGEFIATPVEWDEEAHGVPPKIRLHMPRNSRPGEVAGVGDRALLRIEDNGGTDGGIRYTGRVIKVIERVKARVLGIFRAGPGGGGRISPVDKKQLGREFVVPPGATRDAQDGDLVAVETAPPRRGFGLPGAAVTERLGSFKSEKAVSLIAIHAHSIPDVFPPAVLKEAEAAKPARLIAREDWRDVPFVTIDPSDAKDHDDAVQAEPDADPANPGGFVLRVAIADVALYVQPGSALDREALVRGNSVYFPDRVVPMLPERISNDLCSLRPLEDRAAIAVRMVIGADGRKRDHTFHRVLIRSAAKLSYQQAQAAIDGHPDDTTGTLVRGVLEPLYAAYAALKKAREERSPLDLDIPERKILLKPDGTVDRIVMPERLDSHRLIEEFMILANVAAAETLEKATVPLIYRVHDEPDMERVNALREFLKTLDISLTSGALRPGQFNHILNRVKGREVEKLVNEVVLRSQAQAEYASENYGHFGLNLRRYAHFTSPIRRYADLVVHRGLVRALHLGDGALPADEDGKTLGEIAATISATERRAMKAERETFDRLLAHFLADKIGSTFEGRISGVTRAGLFVKLDETGADGFIPARFVGTEYFRFHEDRHALIGDSTGETYRLGDHVTVKLVEAAPVAGALRFELLSDGHYAPAKGRKRDQPHDGERPPAGGENGDRAATRIKGGVRTGGDGFRIGATSHPGKRSGPGKTSRAGKPSRPGKKPSGAPKKPKRRT
jgi:ribonuclease R